MRHWKERGGYILITPDKHTNLKFSTIYISGIMMNEIKKSGIIKYSDLQKIISSKIGKQAQDMFELSISFLYLLNKIEYNEKLDSILLTEK